MVSFYSDKSERDSQSSLRKANFFEFGRGGGEGSWGGGGGRAHAAGKKGEKNCERVQFFPLFTVPAPLGTQRPKKNRKERLIADYDKISLRAEYGQRFIFPSQYAGQH